MRLFCIAMLSMISMACSSYGTVPGSIVDHAMATCSVHGGIKELRLAPTGGQNVNLEENSRVYCTDFIVACKDNFTELSYDSCNKKWYPDAK